jgi:hypothetical protein
MYISKNQFRLLVIIYFILSILSGAYDELIVNTHIEFINNYLHEQDIIYYLDEYISIIFVVVTIGILVNFVGLLLFKNWARLLYLILYIAAIPTYLFDDVTVFSSVALMIYDFGMILSGFILALLYFSNVGKFFNKKKG